MIAVNHPSCRSRPHDFFVITCFYYKVSKGVKEDTQLLPAAILFQGSIALFISLLFLKTLISNFRVPMTISIPISLDNVGSVQIKWCSQMI